MRDEDRSEDQRLICRCLPDGTLTFVNDAYCRYFDKGRHELIDRSFLPFVAEGDRARVLEHLRALGPHNPAGILEHRVIGRRGQVRWHLRVDQVLLDHDGQLAELETVARDITEEAPVRTELRRREASIRAFFESATEAIVAVDRGGQIVLVNPRAEAMFGYEREELLGHRLTVLIPERIRHAHQQYWADYFGRPRARPLGSGVTLMGRRKDGSEFPVEIGLTYVPDEEGGLAMALVTDISQRVEQERHARHLEKVAALGSLAVGIAHELNNPIATILSRVELMIMEVEEPRGTPELIPEVLLADLQALHRQAQRLTRIAQGILSFGRQRERNRQPIDLGAVVSDTLLLVANQLSRGGIHVDAMLDGGLPQILGDPTALDHVLVTLLLDALYAMPAGGTIRIETSVVREPGQPDAVRLLMSHPGYRTQESPFATEADGTGLDLSISYAIIRDQGGTIDVRSEPGRGTILTLGFPPVEGAAGGSPC